MSRKLAKVAQISDISHHPYADRLDIAKVDGWDVVVGRDQFTDGDTIIFFEPDAILPASNPAFADIPGKRATEPIPGTVIRIARLRGKVSQGFVMDPSDLGYDAATLTIGTDLAEELGVVKWEEQYPINSAFIGPFATAFAPKTDAERIQNLRDHWDEITALTWTATVKVDGASHTLVNDEGRLRLFARNNELTMDTLTAPLEVVRRYHLDAMAYDLGADSAIQFELCGPKFQGNPLKLESNRPFIFAVWQHRQAIDYEEWPQEITAVAVPLCSLELTGPYEEMQDRVNALEPAVTPGCIDEGVVWHLHSACAAPLWLDSTRNIKLISQRYLLGES